MGKTNIYAGGGVRTHVPTKGTDLESVAFDHSATPAGYATDRAEKSLLLKRFGIRG